MNKPTGKLKYAYQTIINMQEKIEQQQKEIEELKTKLVCKDELNKSMKDDIKQRDEVIKDLFFIIKNHQNIGDTFWHEIHEVEYYYKKLLNIKGDSDG